MPAEAPQATSSRSRGTGAWVHWPIFEATAAASCTSGPSRPIEPPDPMVKNEDAACSSAARLPSWPLPTATASM